MDKDMVTELGFGQMDKGTRESGNIINITERESYGIQMGIFMMENGRNISLTALVFT